MLVLIYLGHGMHLHSHGLDCLNTRGTNFVRLCLLALPGAVLNLFLLRLSLLARGRWHDCFRLKEAGEVYPLSVGQVNEGDMLVIEQLIPHGRVFLDVAHSVVRVEGLHFGQSIELCPDHIIHPVNSKRRSWRVHFVVDFLATGHGEGKELRVEHLFSK